MIKINRVQVLSQGTFPVPWLTVGLTLLMVVLFFMPERIFHLFLFDKQAISHGELWRFITGHFIHCSFEHLFWDALAFVILGTVIEFISRRHLIPSLIISCLGVSFWLFCDETLKVMYCGLSGALNGMLVVAAVVLWKDTQNGIYFLVIVAAIGKIVFELITHQTIFTGLSSQAVPSAHAAGIFSGICYILCVEIIDTFLDRVLTKSETYTTNIREIDYGQ